MRPSQEGEAIPERTRRAASWWLLLLLFVGIGPLLFATTHLHRRSLLSDAYRIRNALGSLSNPGSVRLLTELAGQLRGEQLRATLQGLHDEAERTGRLGSTCRLDPAVRGSLDRSSRFLISANLHNSASILPHWATQLAAALGALPPENVFVSIYESGSSDDTGRWLDQLRLRLALLRIRYRITTGGNITRDEGEPRIAYLAKLRNEALAPMLGAEPEFEADYVVFLNDALFWWAGWLAAAPAAGEGLLPPGSLDMVPRRRSHAHALTRTARPHMHAPAPCPPALAARTTC
jgi:hypothetical protein